jgi:hypothetical protein
MVQFSATRCSCISILWVSLVSFAAITLCIASQRVFVVVDDGFIIDSVRTLFHTPSYTSISAPRHPNLEPFCEINSKNIATNIQETLLYFCTYFFGTEVTQRAVIALGYGLDNRGSRVRFPAGTGNFSLHHRVQNGSGAHPASYSVGTRGSFPGGKAAGAWS